MSSSPDLKIMSDSEDDEELKHVLKPYGLDSEGESQGSEDDARNKAAQDFVASYCQAFDSAKHADLVELVAPDVTFDWFGEEVHGPQTLQQFMASKIPDTRHLGVTVEPCLNTQDCTENHVETRHASKRKHSNSTGSPGTNIVHVQGKLQFTRDGKHRKTAKEWKWERNFKLQVSYSEDKSPEQQSPPTKWRIQQVVYKRTGHCKRALFM